jgi:hypothetical protein
MHFRQSGREDMHRYVQGQNCEHSIRKGLQVTLVPMSGSLSSCPSLPRSVMFVGRCQCKCKGMVVNVVVYKALYIEL